MLKIKLPKEIKTVNQAESFLTLLLENNIAYHPEDDAKDCLENILPAGMCEQINRLMDEVYDIDGFDPCEYLLNKIQL